MQASMPDGSIADCACGTGVFVFPGGVLSNSPIAVAPENKQSGGTFLSPRHGATTLPC